MWHWIYWCRFCFINLHSVFELCLHGYGEINMMVKFMYYSRYRYYLSFLQLKTFDLSPIFPCCEPCCNHTMRISRHARTIIRLRFRFWKWKRLLTRHAPISYFLRCWHTLFPTAGLVRPSTGGAEKSNTEHLLANTSLHRPSTSCLSLVCKTKISLLLWWAFLWLLARLSLGHGCGG